VSSPPRRDGREGTRSESASCRESPRGRARIRTKEQGPPAEHLSKARDRDIGEGTARTRLAGGQIRDETAAERDEAARERDVLAAQRDQDASVADVRAVDLDDNDARFGRHTLRLRELRTRGVGGHRRAALGRDRAERDRIHAADDRRRASGDREFGALDREESRRDREHAGIDELTGARRRGIGLEELEREVARARRTGANLVVAFVDVDGLKNVNDEEGHHAGDDLLRESAKALKRHMRTYDLLVRFGGDEFLCILPGASADEVRRRFLDLGSQLTAGATGSISIGLTEMRDGDQAQDLIDRADQDMVGTRRR
jgi:diguanylate cyclase (GGDEF)-like protein